MIVKSNSTKIWGVINQVHHELVYICSQRCSLPRWFIAFRAYDKSFDLATIVNAKVN